MMNARRSIRRISLVSVVIAAGFTVAAASGRASGALTLDADGRTLGLSPAETGRQVFIEVLDVHSSQRDRYELRYRPVNGTGEIFRLDVTDEQAVAEVEPGKPLRFQVHLGDSDYVAYNLWRRHKALANPEECEELVQLLETLDRDVAELRRQVEATQEGQQIRELLRQLRSFECESEELEKEILAATEEIKELRERIKSYEQISVESTVDEIRRIYEQMDHLLARRKELELRKKELEDRCATTRADLEGDIGELEQDLAQLQISKELTRKESDLDTTANRVDDECPPQVYSVLKMGLLIRGQKKKAFYYDLNTSKDPAQPLSVKPLGPIPILTQRDRLLVVLVNYREQDGFPDNFKLSVSATAGTPINSELVRPVFGVTSMSLRADERVEFADLESAYRDLVLPAEKRFKPFDIPKVTLSTVIKVQTSDSTTTSSSGTTSSRTVQQQEFKLLDEVEYPVVHGLYRYNFNGGVVVSGLRDSEFVKVKVAADDSATNEDETRFRIDEIEKDRDVTEVVALTYYWNEVDILKPITWREAIVPHPTIGFGVTNPEENVFVGFNHNVARNVQMFWGMHFGKVTVLRTRNDVSEDQVETPPPTGKDSDEDFFVGLTFNLQVLANIFK